jgi:hypothetical protein
MDLWTARLRANRAVLPWITTRPLPTAPPSDHNSTDPQNQDLFDMGFKSETRSLTFELIEAPQQTRLKVELVFFTRAVS